jgi:drug/metabolite transporter (DMT)-like permease
MNPLFWGFASAACWGTSNFAARLTGRAIGPLNSLMAMNLIGVLAMSLWLWLREAPLVWEETGLHWLLLIGIGNAMAMLSLYAGLSRGPVSIASPVVASSPAFVVAGGLLLGIVPTAVQLIGMAGIMAGVLIVARSGHRESGLRPGESGIALTVIYGLGAAILFACSLYMAREAVPVYGALQVAWVGRGISFFILGGFMLATRTRVNMPMRWWPALVAQGFLDTAGMIAIFEGSVGNGAPLASVGAAPVAIIVVILARIFLRERIPAIQWLGIGLVVAAGAGLAYNTAG